MQSTYKLYFYKKSYIIGDGQDDIQAAFHEVIRSSTPSMQNPIQNPGHSDKPRQWHKVRGFVPSPVCSLFTPMSLSLTTYSTLVLVLWCFLLLLCLSLAPLSFNFLLFAQCLSLKVLHLYPSAFYSSVTFSFVSCFDCLSFCPPTHPCLSCEVSSLYIFQSLWFLLFLWAELIFLTEDGLAHASHSMSVESISMESFVYWMETFHGNTPLY